MNFGRFVHDCAENTIVWKMGYESSPGLLHAFCTAGLKDNHLKGGVRGKLVTFGRFLRHGADQEASELRDCHFCVLEVGCLSRL